MAPAWSKLKVVDLRSELKRRGLPQNGLKGELIARLEAVDSDEPVQHEGDDQREDPTQPDEAAEADADPEADPEAESAEAAPEPEPVSTQPASRAVTPDPPQGPHGADTENDSATATATDTNTNPALALAPADVDAVPEVAINPVARSGEDHELLAEGPVAGETLPQRESAPKTHEPDKKGTSTDLPPDAASDAQKRKRRSASPPSTEETPARKRARADNATNGETAHVVDRVEGEDLTAASTLDEKPTNAGPADRHETREAEVDETEDFPRAMEYERDVAPAVHHATAALYIGNLMRPLRPIDVRTYLAHLADTSPSDSTDEGIVKFHLDQIRTHAFVVFNSTSAASRVRTALHDCVWPNESNRKALLVDFIPPERVDEWIDLEESSGGGRSGSRWEVVYRNGPNGDMEAHLESATAPNPRPGVSSVNSRPLHNLAMDSANAIPVGPRSQRFPGQPPTGPRATRQPLAPPLSRPPPTILDHVVERTRSKPAITYQLVSSEVARRRVENMRSFYTRDTRRDLGREINRYSFENSDFFVDRGKEIFEGIRPPHRERARELERRGGGRGGGHGGLPPRRGPPRPKRDRYLPASGGGGGGGGSGASARGDRRPRRDDDNRSVRHGGDRDWGRDRDHRDHRHSNVAGRGV